MLKIVDIHCHMMPGVDDGSVNMAMTGRMLEIASAEGIDTVILTPHYKPGHRHVTPADIREFADTLTRISAARDWDMSFYPGNELMFHSGCVQKIDEGRVCTLADTEYVLVEFEPWNEYDRINNGLREMIYAGYKPVVAHVERYACIADHPERVVDLTELGCLIQVNAASISGEEGRAARAFTLKLLKDRRIHFVATDAHSDGTRAPKIRKCAELVGKRFGAEYAERIFEGNARRIIRGEDVV